MKNAFRKGLRGPTDYAIMYYMIAEDLGFRDTFRGESVSR